MRIGLRGLIAMLGLVFGLATAASAQQQQKSWEVDIYGNDADVTYVPDGRDDVHVYDHNNHYNDRSYIEIDRPYYRGSPRYYDNGHRRHRGHRGYGYRYERPRYRVEYHNRNRYW